jgi:O-antigen ligase
VSSSSTFDQELARARSVRDTDDPNARYRLDFWQALAQQGLRSPLYGAGFDDYALDVLPEGRYDEPRSDPHNSFVALLYRVGLIPVAALLCLLGVLVARGVRLARNAGTRIERAVCGALAATVIYAGVFAFFNVSLEAPYLASLFWIPVGLLAGAVARARARGGEDV